MIFRKQLFRHDPANGVFGDCHRTAIACLLNLEPEQVPHFGANYTDAEKFWAEQEQWLAQRQLCIVTMPYGPCTLEQLLAHHKHTNPGIYYLLGGKSATGCGHTVVACGGEIVWDPSLNESGIVGPMDDDFYWCSWLLPLSMKKVA